jgi:hypothetical protein
MTWFFCGLCVIVGIVLFAHTLLQWDQVDVIVEWETASELDTVGFNLLRSESPDGTYTQVNTELIPTGSDSLSGHQYTYKDSVPKADISYYYILEEIEISGIGNQHGPIEVTAHNSAIIELILSLLLIVGATIILVYSRQDSRNLGFSNSDE